MVEKPFLMNNIIIVFLQLCSCFLIRKNWERNDCKTMSKSFLLTVFYVTLIMQKNWPYSLHYQLGDIFFQRCVRAMWSTMFIHNAVQILNTFYFSYEGHNENKAFLSVLCYQCHFFPLHQENGAIHFLHSFYDLFICLFIFHAF